MKGTESPILLLFIRLTFGYRGSSPENFMSKYQVVVSEK